MASVLSIRDPKTGKWVPIPAFKGDKGDSGVHIGTEEPTDDSNVWIDPDDVVTEFKPLTFTGAVNAVYDGSKALNVEISNWEIPRVEMSENIVVLEPNKFYIFPEMASLSITLGGEVDVNTVQEYKFRFVSGATATTLTLPESVIGNITVEANSIVEVSIIDNFAVCQSWVVSE